MTSVQDALLDSKMTEIERARSWSPRVISKLEGLIRDGTDTSLYRVNPLAFARDRSIAEAEAIDLFLHAARSGLFEMHWDVLCPQSGMVLESFGTLRSLKTEYVCGLCDVSGETDLDDFIEVTFSLSPDLRRLSFHAPDSLSVEDYHWMLRFSDSCRLPGLQTRFLDYLKSVTRAMTFLPPRTTTTLNIDLTPGAIAGVNIRTQAAFMLPVAGGMTGEPQALRVAYDGQRFSPTCPALSAGPALVEIDNIGDERGSLLLLNWPPEIVAMTAKPALDFDPYVSGGMLLARESFRRLFRSERVDEQEGLGIRQVTLLFTDLKGSTSMYERLGDLNAYALVREHFAFLHQVAQGHSGAIVKTIGDAVMAVFSRPADAVSAALHIVDETGRFNRRHGGPGIILKLGAHCGPSIAVTLNDNLDYFGQTVNIAARVQSLAGAGEICITDALHAAPGVKDLLSGRTLTEFDASLRGVEGDAHVYRITA
jgi:class 3 adenylate cyclase